MATVYDKEHGFQSVKSGLPIEQSLKFLDTLGFGSENEEMFHARESHQVAGTIVALNSVKVMDDPSFWYESTISFLPHKYMLKNVRSSAFAAGVSKATNHNIAVKVNFSAFPVRIINPCLFLAAALIAQFGMWAYQFTAFGARFVPLLRMGFLVLCRPLFPVFEVAKAVFTSANSPSFLFTVVTVLLRRPADDCYSTVFTSTQVGIHKH